MMFLLKIRVESGCEVMDVLEREFKKREINDGAICSIIGAVDRVCISNMPKSDATQDILTEYTEPFELNGCGEIRDGKPHIHCNLSREGDSVISGHLHWAHVDTWYVSVFIVPI